MKVSIQWILLLFILRLSSPGGNHFIAIWDILTLEVHHISVIWINLPGRNNINHICSRILAVRNKGWLTARCMCSCTCPHASQTGSKINHCNSTIVRFQSIVESLSQWSLESPNMIITIGVTDSLFVLPGNHGSCVLPFKPSNTSCPEIVIKTCSEAFIFNPCTDKSHICT